MDIKKPVSDNPIPEHAKKVFTGKIFDVYQWEQQGYDGKIHIHEKLKRRGTAFVIPITAEGKIIVAKQEQPGVKPFVGLVGGRFEEGEVPLEAAGRELSEETGYEAESWELFAANQPVSKIEWEVYFFIAKGCHKVSEQHLDGAEKVEMLFLSFEEFVETMLSEECRDTWLKMKLLEAKLDSAKMGEMRKQFGL